MTEAEKKEDSVSEYGEYRFQQELRVNEHMEKQLELLSHVSVKENITPIELAEVSSKMVAIADFLVNHY